jgi:hypothetical protein
MQPADRLRFSNVDPTMVSFLITCACDMPETIWSHFKKHILMRVESLTSWPKIIPEATLTARARRQKPGVVKLLTPPPPPDQKTIKQLNMLASNQPFCRLHRVKKHDPL